MRTTPITWPGDGRVAGPAGQRYRFSLLADGMEVPLELGETILGRSSECHLVVEDMLVSRQHARLFVSQYSVFLEDLESANGTFVNEQRITGAVALSGGESLVLGSQELLVRAEPVHPAIDIGSDAVTQPPRIASQPPPQLAHATTASAAQRLEAAVGSGVVPRRPGVTEVRGNNRTTHPGIDEHQRTEKADALVTMARLADRMLTRGRSDAAIQLLSEHLNTVALRARQGERVPPTTLEVAGLYAMKLTDVSGDLHWAHLALDLHIQTRRPLSEKALDLLSQLLHQQRGIDPVRLADYQLALVEAAAELSPTERALADRIANLR